MRLPQSFTHPFCPHIFSILICGAFTLLLLSSQGAAAQQLTASSSSLTFGNVPLGQSETQLIVLANNGTSDVTVSTMKVLGSEFSTSNVSVPFSVAAGQSVSLNVTFTPTVTGWTGGWVDFTSNASNATLDVQVQGSGNKNDTLFASPSTVSFGQVAIGGSSTQSVVLTNRRNYKVQIANWKTTGGAFTVTGPALPMTLRAGQSVTVKVSFSPSSAGISGGNLFVYNEALDIPLNGTGTSANTSGQLSVSPSTLNFGSVNVGSTGAQSLTLTASGASVTLSSDVSSNPHFTVNGPGSLPLTIAAGQSMTFNVVFKPTASGTASGSLQLASNASDSNVSVAFTGNGTTTTTAGQLSISPTSLNFGNVNVGSTGTEAITMSASGASVTVSSDTISNSRFVLNGASLPFTIPAGQSMSFNVGFTPTANGTVSGSLTFNSNAATAQVVESLAGTGTTPQYSVSLSWNASAGVAGYNVYRSTSASGSYVKINSSLDANTAYTDSSVAAGQTYYYEASAVDSSGQESARSSPPVSASIP